MSRCFPTHGHDRKKENQLMTASFCDRTTGGRPAARKK
jgi:hypothetical protein